MTLKVQLEKALAREQVHITNVYGAARLPQGGLYRTLHQREAARISAANREALFALIDNRPDPLILDGFMCTPDHAVEVAHMVSNLEAAYEVDRDPELLRLFGDYLRGNVDTNDVNEALYSEWSEAFPGLTREEND